MLIRPPTADETPLMARIESAARAAAEARWSPPPASQDRPVHQLDPWRVRRHTASTRVAIVDTRVVGCIAWGPSPVDGLPTAFGPFVDPLHERTGVGRALLAVAMRRSRLAGADRMVLWVPAADARARAFARALGFVIADGHRPLPHSEAGELRRLAILPAGLAIGR